MEKKTTLPLIYVIGMPIIYVISIFIANLHVEVMGTTLYFISLVFSLVFLISGLIIRKTDYKDALLIMAVSLVGASLTYVVQWVMLDVIDCWVMFYSFISFLICQVIFICGFNFLESTNKDSYMPVFLLILIVNVIDNILFGILIEGKYISLSILPRLIYSVVLPIFLAKNTSGKDK